jgi:hypothetical protein
MAPLDPDLVIALDKMMRSDLDAWSSLWFWILVGSTIAVAIGIIAEAPEVWKEVGLGREIAARIRKWWYIRVRRIDLNGWEKTCPELITKNDSRRRWIVKAAFIGWLLVAVGVAGEGIAEYFVNDAETGIRAFDEARLAETMEQAGDAAKSAKTAHAELDAVEKKSVAIQQRLDKASAHLGTLEKDVIAYGPRWPLLQKNAPKLIKQFAPFVGQRAELFICTNRLTDGEAMATWGKLANILGKGGAKWNLEGRPEGINVWDGGPSCQGLEIFVGPNASKRTMRAAKSLSSALENILPPSPNPLLLIVPPEVVEAVHENPNWKNAPFVVAGRETDLITVFIGEHPNLGTATKNKKNSK